MNSRFYALTLAATIGLIIVSIGLGFLIGMDNPVPWLLIAALVLGFIFLNKQGNTPKVVWKAEYSVGVKVLDDDHKKLILLLNKFQTAYDFSTDENFERQALEELIDYTRFHFEREEQMMADAGYPDLENHKQQHRDMINQVEVFVEKYRQQGHDSLNEVSDFLCQWLISHINGTDKRYSATLKSKGMS